MDDPIYIDKKRKERQEYLKSVVNIHTSETDVGETASEPIRHRSSRLSPAMPKLVEARASRGGLNVVGRENSERDARSMSAAVSGVRIA